MVFQHAHMEIVDIPENIFPNYSDHVRRYFQTVPSRLAFLCEKVNYDPSYISLWAECIQYNNDTRSITNTCTVYAHPLLFDALLEDLILDLANAFPAIHFHVCFRIFHSNWGFSHFPVEVSQGIITRHKPILAQQQPDTQMFWEAMQEANYTAIPELLEAMYAPMTDQQLYDAFGILDDLFFDPTQEIQPVDGYYFDDEGIPERESMVDFTYICFLRHCWEDYQDIWAFFRAIREQYSKKDIPFEFPENFLAALNCGI